MATSLVTVAWLDRRFSEEGIAYWIFEGFAVDLHLGEETRPHDDVDVAVSRDDFARAVVLLVADGWKSVSREEDHSTFVRAGDHIDLAPVGPDEPGWPPGAFGDDIGELGEVRARVVTRAALIADKSELREDLATRAKDAEDLRRLTRSS